MHSGRSSRSNETHEVRRSFRYYFRQWRDRTQEDKDERQLTQYALEHYHRALKRQVLLAWHQEMIQQMSLDNENQMKFNHYRAEKNQQQLREIYARWKEITARRRRERFLLQRAEVFFQRSLVRKAFGHWKEQHQFDLRVKVRAGRHGDRTTVFSYSSDKRCGSIECV